MLLISQLPGCAPAQEEEDAAFELRHITAISRPIYAVARNIVSDIPDVLLDILIQPQDGCLRTYNLSEWDAILISQTDALVIGGRGFEAFEAALEEMVNGPLIISLMANTELIRNGEMASEEANHFEGENPWLFLSTGGAQTMAEGFTELITTIDATHEAIYHENLSDFIGRLYLLRHDMKSMLEPIAHHPIALMHEGLEYFTDEWSLNVTESIAREPGTTFGDMEWEDVLSRLHASGAKAVVVERQAPMPLTSMLSDAGFKVIRFDTLSTLRVDGDKYIYETAMLNNAKAFSDAFEIGSTQ